MLFLKLAIAAVLALTVSATPTQKDIVNTDAALQRRATAAKIFARSHYEHSQCAQCERSDCVDPRSICNQNGCC
ncbi:uncharacterized protein MELLADRAFT_124395 [Melampsora larici-populina 98AG31]|uniref:Secreted protein n=1 Tax=Melampsora larici-populina (strain 98AG31 / pathotype 3-4-7) TaxID=747676 RepID=F4RF50_MELLP|nr:uncharacterized protein MELLADRAFT_124395 [Melampsora larici-populina 98AG31]EGG08999.1 secreted protein [Melampsora larici-populina 98AG31]